MKLKKITIAYERRNWFLGHALKWEIMKKRRNEMKPIYLHNMVAINHILTQGGISIQAINEPITFTLMWISHENQGHIFRNHRKTKMNMK